MGTTPSPVTVQDEGFHEIQLNGKQVVFLFMVATVVSVVIFLCGVLVGRVYASIAPRWPTSVPSAHRPKPRRRSSLNLRRPRLRRRVPDPRAGCAASRHRRSQLLQSARDQDASARELEESAVEKRVAQGNPVELAPVAAKPIPDKAPRKSRGEKPQRAARAHHAATCETGRSSPKSRRRVALSRRPSLHLAPVARLMSRREVDLPSRSPR